MAELSAYWKGDNTWALSKAAHKLADKVPDANLSKEIHDAIAALDKNADGLLSAALAGNAELEQELGPVRAELRKELDGLKGDVKTLRGKVK